MRMGDNGLNAGVGRSTITPAIGARLVGYAGRSSGCTSVLDELFATALVLQSGVEQLAILSCDLLALHPSLVKKVRDLVSSAHGLPGDRLMICCAHGHSGPPGYVSSGTAPIDRAYVEYLPYLLASTVTRAFQALEPVRLGIGIGKTDIAINRREKLADGRVVIGENPAGPCDRAVGVLRLDRREGGPLAIVVNVTCHPVILGPDSLGVSADFVGTTRAMVERATGASMLFLQGACGDINPRVGANVDYASCQRTGGILAGDVLATWAAMEPDEDDAKLAAATRSLAVPLAEPDQSPLPDWLSTLAERIDIEFPWAADVVDGGTPMEVQAFRIGDLGLVAVGCEPFVETGLSAKAGSPAKTTFFAGYSNGDIGYVPTAAALEEGGYEAELAHRYYRQPAAVAPRAERLVAETATASLAAVFESP